MKISIAGARLTIREPLQETWSWNLRRNAPGSSCSQHGAASGRNRASPGQRGSPRLTRLPGRGDQDLDLGNIVIPFDERWDAAEAPHRMLVERPHLGANRMVVSVEQIAAVVAMAGEMELDHTPGGNRVDIAQRIEAMVKGADEDVVEVEQNRAVGLLRHGA